ncbi:CPBP family intramembrane glutamic endopeptidase [Terrisporobacter glycolicus]|uniref:CAAX prenyl protease 2/Lysostaphin resistance protein A-like domain-containing protein n=2 Tax=Terrisporobacter glycolicus TaxID=36841 RepID=A0ABZ2EZ01_9FIRM|nr:CPBP family intramembrane glutamic endopeptidase [Terrisporobacter glycolicus]
MNNSSELNNNENSYTMIKIVALLIGLQISRIALKQSAFLFLSYSKFNDVLISMIVMFLLTLFVIYKSKKEKISLDIFSYMKNKESKIYYFIVTGAVLGLIFTSPSFLTKTSIESILPLLYTTIMTPIYEELLFRSYIWNVLKQENEDEVRVYFLTTVLFSIYHIGYIDTIIMTSGFNHMTLMILIKCSLMLSYGFFIGFFRYRIKNSYSCILVHSFINIFNR